MYVIHEVEYFLLMSLSVELLIQLEIPVLVF